MFATKQDLIIGRDRAVGLSGDAKCHGYPYRPAHAALPFEAVFAGSLRSLRGAAAIPSKYPRRANPTGAEHGGGRDGLHALALDAHPFLAEQEVDLVDQS